MEGLQCTAVQQYVFLHSQNLNVSFITACLLLPDRNLGAAAVALTGNMHW